MTLDITTLLIVNSANLLLLTCVLMWIMGRPVSAGVINAQGSLLTQALALLAILASGWFHGTWPDWLLSTACIALTSLSQWLMYVALRHWLGPRPGRDAMRLLVLITPLVYAALFASYPWRVGWANGMLAAQLFMVGYATLQPSTAMGGRWRWVIFCSALAMSAFTLARGVMGAFFTEAYPTFETPHPVNLAALLATNVALVLTAVAVMAAWREEAQTQLNRQPSTDGLTGLANRYGWEVQSRALFNQATRHESPLVLITLELDNFSSLNHTRGYAVGDKVLTILGHLLGDTEHGADLAARTRGDQFSVVLLQTDVVAALEFEARLKQAFARACEHEVEDAVSYSAGVAVLASTDATFSMLQARASRALQRAKYAGPGGVEVAPDVSSMGGISAAARL